MKKVITQAKKLKTDRLISVTCVKEGTGFSMYYHFSLETAPEIKVMKVPVKENEEVESLIPLYENAELLESETTEAYGVKFAGNPSSGKRLFREEK